MEAKKFGEDTNLPISARLYVTPDQTPRLAIEVITDWYRNIPASNLLVIFGEFGSGKSTLLQAIAASLADLSIELRTINFEDDVSTSSSLEVAHATAQHAEDALPKLFLIDNFDSANLMSGQQTTSPDVRDLARYIATGARLVVATRRRARDQSDPFVRQLTTSTRSPVLGIRDPYPLELLPLEIGDIERYLLRYDSPALEHILSYLKQFPALASDHLRRPLLLRMMTEVSLEEMPVDAPVATAELYQRYVDSALSRDYDLGHSRLSDVHKNTILAQLAFDVFRGVETVTMRDIGTTTSRHSTFSISYSRIRARVLELVQDEPSLRLLDPDGRYDWTEDFLATNHILSERTRRVGSAALYREFEFEHATLYEYFIAIAILERFSRGASLGITRSTLSEGTFRSLALYFVRSYWEPAISAELESLALGRLTWADRLIVLYFLEMHEHFGELLSRAGSEYFNDLERERSSITSYFIRKVIAYQLIVAGRESPYAYVDEIRSNEKPDDYETERQLHVGGGQDITESLLQRLHNPALKMAMPIAVFRLGQMGDGRCLPDLEELRRTADERLAALINEAIANIKAREHGRRPTYY